MNQKDKQKQSIYECTAQVTERYLQKIAPYELITESISLQNKEIYELQRKYIEMAELVKKLQPITPEDEQLLKNRQKQHIMERKMFMEEALVAKQFQYKCEYEKQKNQLEEQIRFLKSDIQMKKGNKINIFMNLTEGILNQLLEQNKSNEDATNSIKYWKDAYERSKRTEN